MEEEQQAQRSQGRSLLVGFKKSKEACAMAAVREGNDQEGGGQEQPARQITLPQEDPLDLSKVGATKVSCTQ